MWAALTSMPERQKCFTFLIYTFHQLHHIAPEPEIPAEKVCVCNLLDFWTWTTCRWDCKSFLDVSAIDCSVNKAPCICLRGALTSGSCASIRNLRKHRTFPMMMSWVVTACLFRLSTHLIERSHTHTHTCTHPSIRGS